MCGITGFIDYKNISTKEVLKKQSDSLAHRGPDGEGQLLFTTAFATIGLGHRRLSIIDLTNAGSQPMTYLNFQIIFNGEIYNYNEIRDTLITLGHTFNSNSDTEMILHAIKEWGISCIEKFIGMFAFVLYDTALQQIYCVRDRAGVKPFCYFWDKETFIFGSELKSILAHPSFKKEINVDAVAAFMQFGYVPTPHCIWKNTYKLKPGHYLKFDIANKVFSITQYWNVYDAYNKPKLKIGFNEAIEETEKIIQTACNYRMVADVPVGIFLSGGYDSATVAALLQKDRSEKLKTFTIGMPEAGLNEAPYAKAIATHLGTNHTEYYCTEKEALDIIPNLPFYYDEPFADSSAIPTTLVSKIARKDVTVSLSADAGDEVFAGYNRYDYLSRYGAKVNRMPPVLRKGVASFMSKMPSEKIPFLNKKYLFASRYEKVKNILKDPSILNLTLNLSKQYNDKDVQDLLIQKVHPLTTSFESKELKPEYYSDLSYMMALDYQNYLLDDILHKVDIATMSVSLEGREPFLDHNVIEWAAQLPNEYKYFKGNKKYILKEINKKYIPASLMDRPKMGFGIPLEKWLSHNLKEMVLDYCDSKKIKEQGIFSSSSVENLLTAFYKGKKELANKVWYLFTFQLWIDKWGNN
jgi:asparagine synthase (glutamine-hydrolysing)